MISSVPFVLAVAPHFPARTVAELVAYAKANPNKLNFGAPTGTLPHLTGEMLKTRAGIDIVHIPYKGAATAITDVLSGQMDMAFEPISVMVDLILVNDRTSCTHIVAQAAEEVFLPGSPVSEPCNRVVQVSRFGGPEGLEVVDAPMPTAGRGEARVRVGVHRRSDPPPPLRANHRTNRSAG
jgi:hypothetical protein